MSLLPSFLDPEEKKNLVNTVAKLLPLYFLVDTVTGKGAITSVIFLMPCRFYNVSSDCGTGCNIFTFTTNLQNLVLPAQRGRINFRKSRCKVVLLTSVCTTLSTLGVETTTFILPMRKAVGFITAEVN